MSYTADRVNLVRGLEACGSGMQQRFFIRRFMAKHGISCYTLDQFVEQLMQEFGFELKS